MSSIIRAGVASIDTTVGATNSNTEKAISFARKLAVKQCHIAVFPEQAIGGYPAEDFLQWDEFLKEQWRLLKQFVVATSGLQMTSVIGVAVKVEGLVYNCNAVVRQGRILGIVPKEHLPTYGVFYEKRVFTAGRPGLYQLLCKGNEEIPFGDLVFDFPWGTLATCVCEDSWTPDGPMGRHDTALLHVITNASPFRQGVLQTRREMLKTRSADHECAIVAAYQVGGNDSLVFDGGGFFYQNGATIFEAPRWSENSAIADIDLAQVARSRNENTTWRARHEQKVSPLFQRVKVELPSGEVKLLKGEFLPKQSIQNNLFLPNEQIVPSARTEAFEELIEGAVMGLEGYFKKTKAFSRILISLSGGKDSALTLILAWIYANRYHPGLNKSGMKDLIRCVSMPTKFNSNETRSIARDLAEDLEVGFVEASIETQFANAVALLAEVSGNGPCTATTLGNVQARIRGMTMWNLSNVLRGLWLQTGNMSEKAVGYTTIGGDLMGGYSLIGNIPKTVVSELLEYLAKKYRLATVERLLKTKASAELAEDQFDEDELMPFPVLDACFKWYAGNKLSPADLYRALRRTFGDEQLTAMTAKYREGMLKEWVKRFLFLFHTSIYKWTQAPQAVHLGSLDLDRERALQIPVVNSQEWLEESLREMERLP